MALTKGMLERLKTFVSNENIHLLQLKLTEGSPVYGYVREIGEDFFVVLEVKGKNRTVDELEEIGETTLPLNILYSWTKIEPHIVPRYIPIKVNNESTRFRF